MAFFVDYGDRNLENSRNAITVNLEIKLIVKRSPITKD